MRIAPANRSLAGMSGSQIVELKAVAWDLPLSEPFGIATGAQHVAANVLIEVTLADGTRGQGEAAPFPAVNGETQADALAAVRLVRELLIELDAARSRHIAQLLAECLPAAPSARAGIESALLDAICRRADLSMLHWFGGREHRLETDITIVTGDEAHAHASAMRAASSGFRTLKVKVGGGPLERDLARLRAITKAAPGARLVLDANASLNVDDACVLASALGSGSIALFEQPVAAHDLAGMREVRERTGVRVAADESARTTSDVVALAHEQAADVINIKITKSGLHHACDMVVTARALGLGLMIGGMVESPLAMTVSACLAAGHGGFEFVDLDTPLFMLDPKVRGWVQHGPILELSQIRAGHGIEAHT